MGFGLSAVALDPGAASRVTRSGRADLAVAAAAALLLAGTSLLIALFTLADVLGVGLRELRTPGLVSTYIWDVEVSRAHLIAAALAVVVSVGFRRVRSLGGAAGVAGCRRRRGGAPVPDRALGGAGRALAGPDQRLPARHRGDRVGRRRRGPGHPRRAPVARA